MKDLKVPTSDRYHEFQMGNSPNGLFYTFNINKTYDSKSRRWTKPLIIGDFSQKVDRERYKSDNKAIMGKSF
ncbi:MAG: hypothetical protein F6K35_41475 [Okeania sp. SIO2H7]|nr:hypothetical protein [Okeania sp. SIO2H7]